MLIRHNPDYYVDAGAIHLTIIQKLLEAEEIHFVRKEWGLLSLKNGKVEEGK